MVDFGFKLSKSSAIVLGETADARFARLVALEPDVVRCMSCGSCAGSCTAASFTTLSLRRVILDLQRGQTADATGQIKHCMLCGKCTLVCPRGLNTRHIILSILQVYSQEE